jgi:DNA invertase Pin-like site-specific DNA recombinase
LAKVYWEKASGAAAGRAQSERLLHMLGPGDVVLVNRLDRWPGQPTCSFANF